ncbi:MAG TPA: glycosyltransferase family A protein [Chitinophagaceae bacterium]|nr:glycosyltransferase family A protein [Chitinophagaceae bacterium]
MQETLPLLSIIIPCYNHGRYLSTAINSCLELGYENIEIIVVDDGSGDNTAEVARSFKEVVYIHKENAGLPAARNTGIDHCRGDFISFLDADDWYHPKTLITNLEILIANPKAAFISGCHDIQMEDGSYLSHCHPFTDQFYTHLLLRNFIGNPSTVIYRRATLKKYRFDTSPEIKGCEDYEHYLRITRENEVLHNPIKISVYRKHEANMSNNYALMLNSALNVLIRQKPQLRNEAEKIAWREGWDQWIKFYGYFPVKTNSGRKLSKEHLELIRKYNIRMPVILWKKILSLLNKKKTIS